MFLVSKSQPYGFQCEKTNKKNTTYPAYFSASIFSSWSSKHFFFCLTKKKKKDLLVLVGITFFRVWFFKPLQTVPPQNSGHHLITFFEGHLSFQNSPLWVDVNYLSAQYLKNHFMKHFPTLWFLLRKFLRAQLHLSVVISVFKAHHLGAMWIICLHNISRTTWWNIFLFSGCFFGSFLGCSHWKHTPGFDHGLKLPKCASLW